jgi:hypothetical protein
MAPSKNTFKPGSLDNLLNPLGKFQSGLGLVSPNKGGDTKILPMLLYQTKISAVTIQFIRITRREQTSE